MQRSFKREHRFCKRELRDVSKINVKKFKKLPPKFFVEFSPIAQRFSFCQK